MFTGPFIRPAIECIALTLQISRWWEFGTCQLSKVLVYPLGLCDYLPYEIRSMVCFIPFLFLRRAYGFYILDLLYEGFLDHLSVLKERPLSYIGDISR